MVNRVFNEHVEKLSLSWIQTLVWIQSESQIQKTGRIVTSLVCREEYGCERVLQFQVTAITSEFVWCMDHVPLFLEVCIHTLSSAETVVVCYSMIIYWDFNVARWNNVLHYLLMLSHSCFLFTVCVVCTICVWGITFHRWCLLFFDVWSCFASVHELTILNFCCVFEWEIAYTVRTLYESLADHVREQYMLSTTNNQHHLTFAFRDLVELIHDEGCCFCVWKKSKIIYPLQTTTILTRCFSHQSIQIAIFIKNNHHVWEQKIMLAFSETANLTSTSCKPDVFRTKVFREQFFHQKQPSCLRAKK